MERREEGKESKSQFAHRPGSETSSELGLKWDNRCSLSTRYSPQLLPNPDQMLSSYFPQARRPPVTSTVQFSYSKPSPWSRRVSPASRIRAKEVFYKVSSLLHALSCLLTSQLVSQDDDRRFGHRTIWSILEEPLVVCPVKAGAPSENHGNKAAFDLGYYGSKVTLSPWSSIIPSNLSTAYALSLRPTERRSEFYVAAGKQSGRILSSEDDVGCGCFAQRIRGQWLTSPCLVTLCSSTSYCPLSKS